MPALSLVAAVAIRLLAQVGVTVTAPPESGARDPVLVKVEVTTPAGREVRVETPSFAPFRLLSATRVASVDSTPSGGGYLRAPWQVVEFRYVISPPANAAGRYAFGPFVARVTARGLREAVARSPGWAVSIRGAPPPPPVPAIVARAHPEPLTGISFHALVAPDTVYVGQQATYQVAVFLDEEVRTRLRRNPEFLPPELRSMLAYDLPAGRASLRDRLVDGRRYDVHVFQRAVFPLTAGRVAIPPAQLTYSLPLSSGFFSREESYTARSEPASLVAVEPPAEGRPADWQGAVGVLAASARLDTGAARAGDPLVYTLRVEGTGNVKLLPRPPLAVPWATAVPADERVTVDSTVLTVRGAKEFDWILTPRDTGALRTPELAYAYFDPYARRYDAATAAPVDVRIAPGTLAQAAGDSAGAAPPLAIRARYRGAAAPPLPSRPLFWALIALVPVPAALALAARRPRRAPPPRSPAQRLDALARGAARGGVRTAPDLRDVRRAFVDALADRLALDPDAPSRAGALARLLRRRGVTGETAAATEAMLGAIDAHAYAADRAGTDAAAAARDARDLFRRIDGEACDRTAIVSRTDAAAAAAHARAGRRGRGGPRLRGRTTALLHAAGLGAAAAAARAVERDAAATAFERGVRAYADRRYPAAAADFRAVVAAEPRAPDGWANLGTAAWAAGDTLGAAVGWQHAIRLQPLAADVRARLELLPASQSGWIANVPRVPADAVVALAAALWVAGWIGAALRLARSRAAGRAGAPRGPAHLSAGALTAAVALGIAGAVLHDVARTDVVAIVRTAGPLRAEPVFGSEPGAPAEPTDVARIRARSGAWARVELDGGRAGWIEVDRLAPLSAPGRAGL